MTIQPVNWHGAQPMGGTTTEGVATTGGVTLAWAAATDVGRQRSVNEDAVLASPPVFVVADGMGGHHAGDVASRLVVEHFDSFDDGLRTVQEVVDTLGEINRTILDQGSRSTAMSGMGTTAVGLQIVDNGDRASWLVFNVGDSRVYRCVDGGLEQLSVDHSYVQELVDAGEITAGAARTHPHRNVVTRALGVDEGPQPDLWLRSPRVGERFLLCSDGLTSEVDDEEIGRVLSHGSVEQAVSGLVERALEAGGRDNVSVVVVDVLAVDDDTTAVDTSPREVVLAGLAAPVANESTGRQPTVARRVGPGLDQPVPSTDPAESDEGESDAVGLPGLIDRVPAQSELVDLLPSDHDEPSDGDHNDGGVGGHEPGDDEPGDDGPGDDEDRVDHTGDVIDDDDGRIVDSAEDESADEADRGSVDEPDGGTDEEESGR